MYQSGTVWQAYWQCISLVQSSRQCKIDYWTNKWKIMYVTFISTTLCIVIKPVWWWNVTQSAFYVSVYLMKKFHFHSTVGTYFSWLSKTFFCFFQSIPPSLAPLPWPTKWPTRSPFFSTTGCALSLLLYCFASFRSLTSTRALLDSSCQLMYSGSWRVCGREHRMESDNDNRSVISDSLSFSSHIIITEWRTTCSVVIIPVHQLNSWFIL